MIAEIKHRGIADQVVERIGRQIARGRYAAGDVIDLQQLQKDLAISRSPLREAMRLLEAKGMVIARPNVGTKVRPPEHWDLLDPDVLDWLYGTPAGASVAEQAAAVLDVLRRQPSLSANGLCARIVAALEAVKTP